MAPSARIPLNGGGFLLVEQSAVGDGPVKTGRVGDAVRELPGTLQAALEPVTGAARATLEQLRKACPDTVTVEFGADPSLEIGAVITRSQAGCHLKVTMSWQGQDRPFMALEAQGRTDRYAADGVAVCWVSVEKRSWERCVPSLRVAPPRNRGDAWTVRHGMARYTRAAPRTVPSDADGPPSSGPLPPNTADGPPKTRRPASRCADFWGRPSG
ncbi:CU044_2847 family protein [Streptomyces sp. SAI-229]|jgi:hypothetical protein|uniref:CU044_2847 family protein n=1 Tax=Streptomyces sp. SAI-229 TaxID=3377731 RepID=UPI003C7CF07E